MNRQALTHIGAAMVVIGAFLHGIADAQPDPQAVADAEVIFVGTVSEAEPQDSVYDVRVERMIRPEAPSALSGFEGRDVLLRARTALEAGQRAAFFTRIERIGKHLELAELDRAPLAQTGAAGIEAGVELSEAALREQADQALSARIEAAQAVVVGRVTAIREAQVATQDAGPLSEHHPMWKEAVIEVDEWIKDAGAQPPTVAVRFSDSNDVIWYGSPKLGVGESGVFILPEIQPATAAGGGAPAGELTDPANLLSSDQAARVKRLLER